MREDASSHAAPSRNITQTEKALNLVFFCHGANLTGAERSLLSLVDDLVGHRGAICTIILPQHGPLEQLLRDAGATVAVMPFSWWCGPNGATQEGLATALSADVPAFFCDVLPFVKSIDPDLIVTQTMVIPWGAAAAAALSKPHIWSICEYGELDHGLHFVEPVEQIAAEIQTGSDFVFVNSLDVKKTLFPDLPLDRCGVLYRHIEMSRLGEVATFGDRPDRQLRVIGLFGELLPSKGQLDAIKAVASLKARGMPVELVLAGAGQPGYVEELRRHAQDLGVEELVRFTGFLEDPYPAMRACDIVLVCSRREAFGRTAVEAMLMAKPLIYAASGGVAEYIEDGKTGLSYPPGEFKALADRIEILLCDTTFATRLGHAAEIFARTTFTRENYGGKFFERALKLRGAPNRYSNFPKALLPAIQRAAEIQGKEMATLQKLGHGAADLQTELAAAHSQIEALVATKTAAEERHAIAIAENATLESRIATRVAEVTEAEHRIAEYCATLDDRNAQLIEAHRTVAALKKSIAEHDQELGQYARRIAVMKSSLSWRLTSPFREVSRPFRGLRESELAVKLSAALRHPTNSRKRKKYRLLHERELTVAATPHAGGRTPLAQKLRAVARHPFSRRLRRNYRKQLQDSVSTTHASASRLSASRSYILKVTGPRSINDVPNWLIYRFLKMLARQTWILPERRAYKFRKSANKRAAMLNRRDVQLVLQEMAHNDLISLEETALRPSAAATTPLSAHGALNEIDRHPIGFRAEMLVNLQPLDKLIADWTYRPPKRLPVSRPDFLSALKRALVRSNGNGILAFSHDNYRKNVGGLQLCILIEETAFIKRGFTYIHLCPAHPLPVLASQASQSSFDFAVTIDGVWLGHVSAADLLDGLATETRQGRRFRMAVHSLLGHSPEIVAQIYKTSVSSAAFFWLHDYFSLCPNYTLMRNTVSPCGAPPIESASCGICHAGEHRRAHLERFKFLFSQVPFTVVAPSDFALRLWQRATNLACSKTVVQEHCEIIQAIEPAMQTPNLGDVGDAAVRPLNIAYLGMPFPHKGWAVFAEIVAKQNGNPDFRFHHLGKSKAEGSPPDVAFTPVAISSDDWNAMSTAVRAKKIDVAILCSLWPETYNFTAIEALTGGALIVTLECSGNIAAIVRAHDCGVVFQDEIGLMRAFADGTLAHAMRRLLQKRPQYQVTHRDMTASLFSDEENPINDRSLLHEHIL